MFDYNKLFKPYERKGFPLETVIEWLQKTTGASADIIEQVVSDTLQLVAQGQSFESEDKNYPDMAISHYMENRVREIQAKINKTKVTILQDIEKLRIERRMKQLSKFDKEYDKMINETWSQKNLPTFCKWIGKDKK